MGDLPVSDRVGTERQDALESFCSQVIHIDPFHSLYFVKASQVAMCEVGAPGSIPLPHGGPSREGLR